MNVEIDPKLCVILMPMRDEFIELYEDVIKPTVEKAGLECLYAGDMFEPKMIMEDIWGRIETARVVIADLTGRNPNVLYEVGYSHSLDKDKVILITHKISDVPSDLRGFRCVGYWLGPHGRRDLRPKLANAIQAVLAKEPQSPRVVTRTIEKPVEVPVEVPVERPAPLDERTREALELYRTIEAMERGQTLMADERVARLLKLPERAKVVRLRDLLPTITLGDIELILVPPGEFTMGSDEGHDDEKPPHEVYVDAFYIGKYPITNAQYKRFVEATGHQAPDHWSGGVIPDGRENHPVAYVNWHDALAYCHWLASETGRPVRLPTEAQWERAARGTDDRVYPWGDEFDESKCNTEESGIGDTTPVGIYSLRGDSPYGVEDMAGNVWEWTSSLYRSYPYNPDDGREDLEAEGRRVLRGCSFYFTRYFARVSYRYFSDPFDSGGFGLRVVMLGPGSA